jgi:hypothetical protein
MHIRVPACRIQTTRASSTSHYGADEPLPRRRYLVPPAVAENQQGGSNFRFSTNDFDCADRGALTSAGPQGLTMLTAMAAIFIVLSIGILIAHALDAFRSR